MRATEFPRGRRTQRARTRRHLAAAVAASMAAGILAACSSSGGSSGASGASSDSTLVIGSYGGTLETGLEKCAVTPFENQYKISVKIQAGNGTQNLAILAAQKKNPSMDLVIMNSENEYTATKDNLAVQYDKSQLPNLKAVESKYIQPGDQYMIPLMTSVGGIEYNTKVFAEKGWAPPTSLADLWNPKYKGHVSLIDISSTYTAELLSQLAVTNGGSTTNFAPAFTKLASLKGNLLAIYQTDEQLDTSFQQGSTWIAPHTGARTIVAKEAGVPVEMVQPKDGTFTLAIGAVIVKNAPHTSAAYKFANFMLSPQVQKCLAPDMGFGPIRSDVSVSSNLANYMIPAAGVTLTPMNWNWVGQNFASLTLQWDSQISAK